MGGHTNFAAEVIEEKQKVFQWIRKWLRENDDEKRQVRVSFVRCTNLEALF